jgi:hypothetical protein
MHGEFDLPELAFPEIPLYLIVVFNRRVPNGCLNTRDPLAPVVPVPAVEHPHLVDREDDLEGEDDSVGRALEVLFFLGLHKDTDQTVHVFVSLVIFFFVAIEFFAKEAIPVTFQFALGGFTEELSFELGERGVI